MSFKIGHRASSQRLSAYLILSLTSLLFLGVSFVLALVYRASIYRHKTLHFISVMLALIYLSLFSSWIAYFNQLPTYSQWLWLSLPFVPLIAEAIVQVIPLIRRAFATDLDEKLAYHLEDQRKDLIKKRQRAMRRKRPPMRAKHLLLAPIIDLEEALPSHTGLYQDKGWLYLSEKTLPQHFFVMGSIGSGKSEFLKYLVCQILEHTDYDLFLVDGKGDDDLAHFVTECSQVFRALRPPIFKLGQGQTGDRYNAFTGDGDDIYNRLLGMMYGGVDMSKVTAGQKHYLDINKSLLDFICKSHLGPPLDFGDLRQRLSKKWLYQTYRYNSSDMRDLRRVVAHVDSLAIALQPLIRDFRQVVTRDGFCLDNARVGIFSVRTQSVGETSRQLLNILNQDLMDFMGKRQQRPTMIIVDEFQAFNSEALVSALSLGRSAGLSLVLATQDIGSLLNDKIQRQIKANAKTKILLSTDVPEELGEIAGTKQVFEHSYQHEEGQVTGVGTSRVQHQHRISLNEVARLQAGEAFLIRQRYSTRLQFRMAELPR